MSIENIGSLKKKIEFSDSGNHFGLYSKSKSLSKPNSAF